MGLLVGEKRKNDEGRRGLLPLWVWTLILGFILGLIVMGAARVGSPGTVMTVSGDSSVTTSGEMDTDAIYATATSIIEQATQAAVEATTP